MDVDLRLLRYFATVADELHFTRAAERLYVSQPALSKAIRRLERELRLDLLVRTSRSVELTAAGRALVPVARRLLDDWDAGLQHARRAAGALRVGYHSSLGGDVTAPVLARFRAQHPGWRVELRIASWADPSAGLLGGQNDVAFVNPPFPGEEALRVTPLREEPRFVAMAAAHPLARRRRLSQADVRDETFVALPAATGDWRDHWLPGGGGNGRPAVSSEVTNPDDWLEAIAGGEGLGLASAWTRHVYRRPGIVWRPIDDLAPSRLAVATRRGEHEAVIEGFVAACVETFAEIDRARGAPRAGAPVEAQEPGGA